MKTQRYIEHVMAQNPNPSPALAAHVEAVRVAYNYDVEAPGYVYEHWVILHEATKHTWDQLTQEERDMCNAIGRAILEEE